jgi:hypothetical protein
MALLPHECNNLLDTSCIIDLWITSTKTRLNSQAFTLPSIFVLPADFERKIFDRRKKGKSKNDRFFFSRQSWRGKASCSNDETSIMGDSETCAEGKMNSANRDAYLLKESIIAHGRTIGASLTEENAQDTIAKWFRMCV